MLQISYDSAQISIEATFREEGSVPEGRVQAYTDEIVARLDITSTEGPQAVEKLVRVSESGCWVLQSLRSPIDVLTSASLNGEPLT